MRYQREASDRLWSYPSTIEDMFSEVLRKNSWFVKIINYTKSGKISKRQSDIWHIAIKKPSDNGHQDLCNSRLSVSNFVPTKAPVFKIQLSNNYIKACQHCLIYYLRKQLTIFKKEIDNEDL